LQVPGSGGCRTKARSMLAEQLYMCTAAPLRASAEPLPHSVESPSSQSVSGDAGGGGCHRSWFGSPGSWEKSETTPCGTSRSGVYVPESTEGDIR